MTRCMHDESDITAHIEAISTRPDGETRRLVSHMLGSCWPGGHSDRTEPGALEWVRRWGPARRRGAPLACSCARGRCAVCN
jgi:hypothetical protein